MDEKQKGQPEGWPKNQINHQFSRTGIMNQSRVGGCLCPLPESLLPCWRGRGRT